MFWTILRFEVGYHLRRPVTWLYFLVLFLLAFFSLASEAMGMSGLVRKNSPYSLTQLTLILTAVGQVITTALVGTAALRDYQVRSHELVFTTRITRFGYLAGRFLGAYLAMLVVYFGIPLGMLVGSLMPWVDADKLLPITPVHYLQPYLLYVTTTVFFISALFFAVGALTRNLFAIYTQGIFLLVAWSVTQQWLGRLDKDAIANAVDAFGLASFQLTTRYWTVAERNSQLLALDGLVLTNRLIWLGVAFALLAVTFALFRFEAAPRSLRLWRRRRKVAEEAAVVSAPLAMPAVAPVFDSGTKWRQLLSETRFSFLRIVRDIPFVAIAAIGGVNGFMNAWYADAIYDVTTWPVTYITAELIAGSFFLFMVILATVYAGESVWRERSLQMDQVADSLPVSSAVTAAGKFLGFILSLFVLYTVLIGVGMLVQTLKGYYNYEPLLYLKFVFGATLPWVVAVALFSFFVHALVNNKFVGHVVLIVYWVTLAVLDNLGYEHQLYQYGVTPGFTYSDMNGFGHFVGNLFLSANYWLAMGLMLGTLAILAWMRGTEEGWRPRVAAARARWRAPGLRLATGGTAFATVAFGGLIFYNTNLLNPYQTSRDRDGLTAEWERAYKPYQHLAPPRIVDVDVQVDLLPEQRAYAVAGRYLVVNQESTPIDSIFVYLGEDHGRTLDSLHWTRPARRVIEDERTGSYLFALDTPLAPGESMELRYGVRYQAHGFPNREPNNRVVANGTFLPAVGPALGYNERFELADDDRRKRQKLPPRDPLPDLDDPAARRNAQFSIDADMIRFAATVSTAPDQIALAPGYLEREWTEGGRRWFRYVMDVPMTNMTTVVSARYEVRRDRWTGADGSEVDIEVYYHPGHEYNLDRMIESVKMSLDYFTTHFSPYQFRVVRILEFPRYQRFAQAFPTTLPYSEGIGFIMRVRERDDDLDMPFFVTAHEVAHQWWGHQVVGANAQGSALMVESMAEYAALTVMEKRYGHSHVHKFLRHELDRYLRGRATERRREQPLIRTENQGYIHYNKGALALYALRDYIGEEAMNRALRAYLTNHAFETAPYSTARDFVGYLRAETPDSLEYVITDLFETITLYDNKTEEATFTRRGDGKYVVTLTVSARKMRADELGNEEEIPVADYMDIGVFGEREKGNAMGRPLYMRKHRITEPRTTLEIVVDEEPRRAGIDPYNKLIDRVPGDNVRDVRRAGS